MRFDVALVLHPNYYRAMSDDDFNYVSDSVMMLIIGGGGGWFRHLRLRERTLDGIVVVMCVCVGGGG